MERPPEQSTIKSRSDAPLNCLDDVRAYLSVASPEQAAYLMANQDTVMKKWLDVLKDTKIEMFTKLNTATNLVFFAEARALALCNFLNRPIAKLEALVESIKARAKARQVAPSGTRALLQYSSRGLVAALDELMYGKVVQKQTRPPAGHPQPNQQQMYHQPAMVMPAAAAPQPSRAAPAQDVAAAGVSLDMSSDPAGYNNKGGKPTRNARNAPRRGSVPALPPHPVVTPSLAPQPPPPAAGGPPVPPPPPIPANSLALPPGLVIAPPPPPINPTSGTQSKKASKRTTSSTALDSNTDKRGQRGSSSPALAPPPPLTLLDALNPGMSKVKVQAGSGAPTGPLLPVDPPSQAGNMASGMIPVSNGPMGNGFMPTPGTYSGMMPTPSASGMQAPHQAMPPMPPRPAGYGQGMGPQGSAMMSGGGPGGMLSPTDASTGAAGLNHARSGPLLVDNTLLGGQQQAWMMGMDGGLLAGGGAGGAGSAQVGYDSAAMMQGAPKRALEPVGQEAALPAQKRRQLAGAGGSYNQFAGLGGAGQQASSAQGAGSSAGAGSSCNTYMNSNGLGGYGAPGGPPHLLPKIEPKQEPPAMTIFPPVPNGSGMSAAAGAGGGGVSSAAPPGGGVSVKLEPWKCEAEDPDDMASFLVRSPPGSPAQQDIDMFITSPQAAAKPAAAQPAVAAAASVAVGAGGGTGTGVGESCSATGVAGGEQQAAGSSSSPTSLTAADLSS